jgi:ATP-dependent Clp protease ATP-binding subunit ClpA
VGAAFSPINGYDPAMTELDLKLQLVQYQSDEDFVLVRALHDRDSARIGANTPKAVQALLQSLAEQLSSSTDDRSDDAAASAVLYWHHQALPDAITELNVVLNLQPPSRSAASFHDSDWLSPVALSLNAYAWQIIGDRHYAVIPALGIHVMTESVDELVEQLRQNALLWLTKKAQNSKGQNGGAQNSEAQNRTSQDGPPIVLGLKRLAELSRLQFKPVESSVLSLHTDTVKQREQQRSHQPKTSVLREVADDLAAIDPPAYQLDTAIAQLAELLTGPMARSVLVVGPAGSGKSTMIAAMARRARSLGLVDRDFWQTSGARLIAGQSGFGMWQERVQRMCRELAQSKAILHLGNLSELMEVGRTQQGEQSIAGFLRTEIARNSITVLAECTPEQLLAIERAEPGLVAAFHVMQYRAPNAAQGRLILGLEAKRLLASTLEPQAQAALDWLARLHDRYAGYSAYPARMLRFLRTLLSAAHDKTARTLVIDTPPSLSVAAVTEAFRRDSGLPAMLLDDQQAFVRDEVVDFFRNRVLGQLPAINVVVDRIAQIKAQLHRGQRPLASLLFIGPTGTGKTELAKALAEFLFASRQRLTRFDLSQVTDAGAVLLDEFEKAHPSFFDLLLQMLGDGRLTDGSGRVADFSNAVIVLTSNLGAKQAGRINMGFNPGARDQRQQFESAVQDFVRPELYNRFDAIVPFAALDQQQIQQIAKREVERLATREGLRTAGLVLQASDAAIAHLAKLGFDAQFGARALKRAVEKELSTPIALALSALKPDSAREAIKPVGFDLRLNDETPPALQISLLTTDKRSTNIDRSNAPRLSIENESSSSAKRDRTENESSSNAKRGRTENDPGQSFQTQTLRAQTLRRKLDALWQCDRVAALRDELTLLNMRIAKAIKRKQPVDPIMTARALALSPALSALTEIRHDGYALETTITADYWQQLDSSQTASDGAATRNQAYAQSLTTLELARTELKRSLFKLGFKQPDQLQLVICSEHAVWLFELLSAYRMLCQQLSGELQLIGVIERSANATKASPDPLKVKLVADIKDPNAVFQAPQIPLLAVVVQVNGPLFTPLFAAEFGLHSFKPAKTEGAERMALVEAAGVRYQPRDELGRAGALASLALERRRAFSVERLELVDSRVEPNKQRWQPRDAGQPMAGARHDIVASMQAALLRAIENFELDSNIQTLGDD